jgi:hypothetical protein
MNCINYWKHLIRLWLEISRLAPTRGLGLARGLGLIEWIGVDRMDFSDRQVF